VLALTLAVHLSSPVSRTGTSASADQDAPIAGRVVSTEAVAPAPVDGLAGPPAGAVSFDPQEAPVSASRAAAAIAPARRAFAGRALAPVRGAPLPSLAGGRGRASVPRGTSAEPPPLATTLAPSARLFATLPAAPRSRVVALRGDPRDPVTRALVRAGGETGRGFRRVGAALGRVF